MAHGCTYCTDDFHCEKFTDEKYTSWCYGKDYPCKDRRISNADRIRAMTDEELCAFLCDLTDCPVCPGAEACEDGCSWDKENKVMSGMYAWLKKEVEE